MGAVEGGVHDVLAVLLLVGGVIGAQIGTRIGAHLKGEQLRGLLAMIVLSLSLKLLYELATPPEDTYSATRTSGHHLSESY